MCITAYQSVVRLLCTRSCDAASFDLHIIKKDFRMVIFNVFKHIDRSLICMSIA